MKLRNKKSGEIVETDYMFGVSVPTTETFGCKSYDQIAAYSSLAELNEEWEDYEEPKTYFCIGNDGTIYDETNDFELIDNRRKSIGNYFETKEEAEKAVEKLKAWKRLKDKGFEFVGLSYSSSNEVYFEFVDEPLSKEQAIEAEKDLDLIFGGEE